MTTAPVTASSTHRLLEHRVAVSVDGPADVVHRVRRLLARFEDPSPEPGVRWSLHGHVADRGRATFTVTRDDVPVCRSVRAPTAVATLLHGLHAGAVASVMATHLRLHAGAVHRDGRGLLVVGPPSVGKSTLTAGLIRAGLDHAADETAPIDFTTGRLRAYPRHVDLDHEGLALLGAASDTPPTGWGPTVHVLPEELRADCRTLGPAGAEVRWIVLPTRHGHLGPASLRRLRPAEAVAELTAHTFDFPQFGGRALRTLATLVEGADCYRLAVGTVHETVDLVARLAHAPTHPPASAVAR